MAVSYPLLIDRGRAAHIAGAYQLEHATIRTWIRRGLLNPVDTDEHGYPRYLIADVLRLAGRRPPALEGV